MAVGRHRRPQSSAPCPCSSPHRARGSTEPPLPPPRDQLQHAPADLWVLVAPGDLQHQLFF